MALAAQHTCEIPRAVSRFLREAQGEFRKNARRACGAGSRRAKNGMTAGRSLCGRAFGVATLTPPHPGAGL
jgi:hypothetical protein